MNETAQLQEYLQVMQPPSKLKTWSNEDLARPQDASRSTIDLLGQDSAGGHDGGDYESVPKKRKSDCRPTQPKGLSYTSEGKPTAVGAVMSQYDEITEKPSLSLEQRFLIASDGDWLRSRTVKSVGLDHTNDTMRCEEIIGIDGVSKQDSVSARQLPRDIVSKSNIQAEAEAEGHIPTPVTGSVNVTGRLFVRNLAYASTEDDLREYFASSGADPIQEVRFNIYFYISIPSHQ